MARWGWSSPFQSDQSLMEAELLPRYNEGRGKVNFEIRKAEEDSEPGFDNPVRGKFLLTHQTKLVTFKVLF